MRGLPGRISSICSDERSHNGALKPVILAEISPDRYNLIDGNHRVEKALGLGLQAYGKTLASGRNVVEAVNGELIETILTARPGF